MKIYPEMIVNVAKSHNKEILNKFLLKYNVVVDAADDYRFKVLLDRKCRNLDIPMIHTSAVGLKGTVVTFIDKNSCYERLFDLPSIGRDLKDVDDVEFENRKKGIIPKLVGNFYPKKVLQDLLNSKISWQTLVPAPIVASGIVVSEIIRIILGKKPNFNPSRPFYFDLLLGKFSNYEQKK